MVSSGFHKVHFTAGRPAAKLLRLRRKWGGGEEEGGVALEANARQGSILSGAFSGVCLPPSLTAVQAASPPPVKLQAIWFQSLLIMLGPARVL